jgi:hypothetical protein
MGCLIHTVSGAKKSCCARDGEQKAASTAKKRRRLRMWCEEAEWARSKAGVQNRGLIYRAKQDFWRRPKVFDGLLRVPVPKQTLHQA